VLDSFSSCFNVLLLLLLLLLLLFLPGAPTSSTQEHEMPDQPSPAVPAADLADAGNAATATAAAVWDSRAAVNNALAMQEPAAYQSGERACSKLLILMLCQPADGRHATVLHWFNFYMHGMHHPQGAE
jgi:hypothetical protein